jgi:hypothetical protein
MIVPLAANMPPTPWQTEILAPGIWAGAVPRIWRTLSCKAHMPECMYERPPPLVLSGIPGRPALRAVPGTPGGGVAFGDEGAGFAARYKAEILESVDRQTEEGVADHQMVDVVAGDAGLGKGGGAGDAEGPRGSEIHHLAEMAL